MPHPATISLAEKLSQFSDTWNPRLIAQLNGQHVKIAKIEGEFVWHHHEHEDELFLVVEGEFLMEMRSPERGEWSQTVRPGEMIVIPRGLEHRPVADQPCSILLFEPASTLNTGSAPTSELTRDSIAQI